MICLFLIYCLCVMSRPSLGLRMHFRSRGGVYPRSNIQRQPVPDDKVPWSVDFKGYNPPFYNSPVLVGKPWADLDIGDSNFLPKWNSLDGNVNRMSYLGNYSVENGYPLNPVGRTGLRGRGVLGKWGPNHAGDPIVTQWKRLDNGNIVHDNDSKRRILQVVVIKRGDTGEWALPGGMVDAGEKVSAAAIREFKEEATNCLNMNEDEKAAWAEGFEKFFSEGNEVHKGYIDDPRNTDNAWIETAAYNFHDENGTTLSALNLQAGDDAVGVRWLDANADVELYANHKNLLRLVIETLKGHW